MTTINKIYLFYELKDALSRFELDDYDGFTSSRPSSFLNSSLSRRGSGLDILPWLLGSSSTVFVKTRSEKTVISMEIEPGHTVQALKREIMDETGIPTNKQHITFDGLLLLEDDLTLDSYGIRHGSVLYLYPYLFDVEAPDFVNKIFVKTQSEKTVILIEIEPWRTVQALKREIMDETGVPSNQQQITFEGNELEDDFTLHSYGIRPGSVLYIHTRLFDVEAPDFVNKIFVKTQSEKTVISIEIEPGQTVRALKREIMDETRIPSNQQHILFHGEELEDDFTLDIYGIRPGSVLFMRPYLFDVEAPDFVSKIFVKTQSEKTVISIEIEPGHTVQVLKRQIMDETGIPTNQLQIIFEGNELEDDFTLHSYGIRPGSVLYMHPCLFDVPAPDFVNKIFVKTQSEKTVISIEIEPGHTVQALRREIMDETGIPTNQLQIIFEGNELEDDFTLHSYGIRPGSVLYMHSCLLDVEAPDSVNRIFVKTQSEKTVISIEIEPGQTVRALKREIIDETGIPTKHQLITFGGLLLLEDDLTLHSYGIRHGSVLYMRPYREARCCKNCTVS